MKTWRNICISYLFLVTFAILSYSIVILFLRVKVDAGSPAINGIDYIKEHHFWNTLKWTHLDHQNIDSAFNPEFQQGTLYFKTGLNLLIVAFPIFLIFSVLISIKLIKKTLYPIPQVYIDSLITIKRNKKNIKSKYKELIKKAKNKKDKIKQKNMLFKKIILLKKEKTDIRNKIKLDYKLKSRHLININNKINNKKKKK